MSRLTRDKTAGIPAQHGDRPLDSALVKQAADLEQLLPSLFRWIAGTPIDHPLIALPIAQMRLCSLLLREGRRTMSQIGDDLNISVSAVTQMADRLERAGMVERVIEPEGDRRTRYLKLTAHGNSLMSSRQQGRIQRAYGVLQELTPEERSQVFEALDLLHRASGSLPEPAALPEAPV